VISRIRKIVSGPITGVFPPSLPGFVGAPSGFGLAVSELTAGGRARPHADVRLFGRVDSCLVVGSRGGLAIFMMRSIQIQRPTSTREPNMSMSTPIHAQITDGRTDLVIDYLSAGHAAASADQNGVPLIQWCAYYGDVTAIKYRFSRTFDDRATAFLLAQALTHTPITRR
jgi:hypothetical protein